MMIAHAHATKNVANMKHWMKKNASATKNQKKTFHLANSAHAPMMAHVYATPPKSKNAKANGSKKHVAATAAG